MLNLTNDSHKNESPLDEIRTLYWQHHYDLSQQSNIHDHFTVVCSVILSTTKSEEGRTRAKIKALHTFLMAYTFSFFV